MLPPCGDKITYEILMNSPTLFFSVMNPSPPFIISDLFILRPDYYIQMIFYVKRKIIQNSPVDTG